MDDFCVFILSHGRPDDVVTVKTLEKCGYTGRLFIVIDNEDKTAGKYYENFGDKVVMFDKEAVSKTFDEGDNFENRKTITYARNACFKIAENLGIRYFIQLDDDYTDFRYKRGVNFEYLYRKEIRNLDKVFKCLLEYYKSIDACAIAMAQGGDFFGHKKDWDSGKKDLASYRKCMNSFICSTERLFQFRGRFNEDVNTYTVLGRQGNLFLTIPFVALQQKQTQGNNGGISELYKQFGTYVKSFTTVMYAPSCVKVALLISSHPRLHHSISWNNAVPVIIRERYRKPKTKNFAVGEQVVISEDHQDENLGKLEKFSVGKIEEIERVDETVSLKIRGKEGWIDAARVEKLGESGKEAEDGDDQEPDHVQDQGEGHQR